tara:strand:- start:47 stop:319 length:273 start_codon:yes stop_codon:yes gene_type:complete
MANSMQSKKRARQAIKRNAHNAQYRSALRTYMKQFRASIVAGDIDNARICHQRVVKYLDQFSQKNIIHKNKANRLKSRFNAQIKALHLAA